MLLPPAVSPLSLDDLSQLLSPEEHRRAQPVMMCTLHKLYYICYDVYGVYTIINKITDMESC